MKTIPNGIPAEYDNVSITPGNLSKGQYIPGTGFPGKNFSSYSNKASRYNNALVNLLMVGTNSHTNITYPNLVMSRGLLPGAENAHASLNNDGNILFSWSDNSGIKTARKNDKVILVTYFPATKEVVYTLHPATRGSCEALLQINKTKGLAADTWIGFASNDERDAGNSVYAGRVNL